MKMVFSSHQRGRRDVTCNGDGSGNKEFKKAIGLLSKSSSARAAHFFCTLSLSSSARRQHEIP